MKSSKLMDLNLIKFHIHDLDQQDSKKSHKVKDLLQDGSVLVNVNDIIQFIGFVLNSKDLIQSILKIYKI